MLRYVRLDVDLVHEAYRTLGPSFLRPLEALLRERQVVEVEGLLRLTAKVLHALQRHGFSRVDHWEVHPGGWLPLPEPAHERLVEPVGHLLNALRSDAWRRVAGARKLSIRLSTSGVLRADLVVHRVHPERGHGISLELLGGIPPRELASLERDLRATVSIVRMRRSLEPPPHVFPR